MNVCGFLSGWFFEKKIRGKVKIMMERMLFKIGEVCEILGISKSKLQELLNDADNCLKRFKIGSSVIVKKEDLEKFIKNGGENA